MSERRWFVPLAPKIFRSLLNFAEVVLRAAFVDIDGHLTACVANEELQRKWWSDYRKNVFGRLLDSVLNRGDGQNRQQLTR